MGQGGAQGGADRVMQRHGQTIWVQCTRWTPSRVGAPVVRERVGWRLYPGAQAAKVVGAAGFTKRGGSPPGNRLSG
ncbi:restriction endonuclease [Burkholderia sp. Ac-20353]|nr:restriction endonuclease [Burkholderia sp. Ac-20353]